MIKVEVTRGVKPEWLDKTVSGDHGRCAEFVDALVAMQQEALALLMVEVEAQDDKAFPFKKIHALWSVTNHVDTYRWNPSMMKLEETDKSIAFEMTGVT